MAQNTQQPKTVVKVPGKVILFGEHAVVYPGNHAIAWSLSSVNVTVQASEADSPGYHIALADLRVTVSFDKLQSINNFKIPDTYIQYCCGLAHRYVQIHGAPRHLQLKIASTIPIGGFGSSAAIAAAIIKAIVEANDVSLSQKQWFELVMEAEAVAHDSPSGSDAAVVTMQKPLIITKQSDGTVAVEPIDDSQIRTLIQNIQLVYSSRPKESTKEVVEFVANQESSKKVLEDIEKNTQEVLYALKNGTVTESDWKKWLNTNGLLLEKLGVVPEGIVKQSSTLRDSGEAVKISGAGTVSGDSCGAIITTDASTFNANYQTYRIDKL